MDEDDLLRRFNALKAPQHDIRITAQTSTKDALDAKSAAEDEDLEAIADGRVPALDRGSRGNDELDRRMRQLQGRDEQGPGGVDEVEAYLSSLSSVTAPAELDDVDSVDSIIAAIREARRSGLEDEASQALGHAALVVPLNDESKQENANSADAVDDGFDPPETEEEIISRALAEAALERANDTSPVEPEPTRQPEDPHEDATFAFPSLPTHLPMDDEPEPDLDEDTKKRLDLLLGLSGPAQKPGQASLPAVPKRAPGQGWNLPGYNDARDEDLDSWCCICNKDADVICLGCDNDAYCTGCWQEGHEFEKHRTKKFTWDRKTPGG